MGQGKNLSELESFGNLGAKPSASCFSRPRIDVFIQLWSNKGVPKLWAHCHDSNSPKKCLNLSHDSAPTILAHESNTEKVPEFES